MNAPPRISALQRTQFVTSGILSAEDVEALEAITSAPRSLRAGVDLVSEDLRTDNIHLLTEGWACRYKSTRSGYRQITGLIIAGDVCNLDSLMLPQVNFGVRTLTAATAIGMPRDRVQALAAERPGVARVFTWLAIAENVVLSELALSLGRQSARERVAHFLCEIAARLGGRGASTSDFELPFTQEQIADVLGLTAVHVNRTLKQLREEGLIVVTNRRIHVPDMAELSRVGEFDGSYLHAVPAQGG